MGTNFVEQGQGSKRYCQVSPLAPCESQPEEIYLFTLYLLSWPLLCNPDCPAKEGGTI